MGDTVSNSQRHKMKQYPSPFKIGDQFTFENKYGKVVLEAIEEPRPVSCTLMGVMKRNTNTLIDIRTPLTE